MVVKLRLTLLLLSSFSGLWLVGCFDRAAEDERTGVTSVRTVDTRVPTVTRVDRVIPEQDSPASANVDHAVSSRGMTLFFRPPSQAVSAGIILDSLGASVATFGRMGSGPGEFRFPIRTIFTDSGTALIFDAGLFRVTTVTAHGKLIRSSRIQTSGLPIAIVADSLDIAEVSGPHFVIVRRSGVGQGRVVVSDVSPQVAGEPAFSSLSPRGRPVIPAFGSEGSRVAIGDPWTYTVLIFRDDGMLDARIHRDLPVSHRTERQVRAAASNVSRWRGPAGEQLDREGADAQARAEVLPHFSHVSPLGFDAGHRLWVIGSEGDSVFADVFAGSQLLTRLTLPCYDFAGRWSIRGNWLSLACGDSDLQHNLHQPVLQLYRIR